MVRFFASRVLQTALVLYILATITFFLLRILPGGPFDAEVALPPEVKFQMESKFRLNRPLSEQYFAYMKNIVTGDFGQSYHYLDQNVSQIISEALPVTLKLGFLSLIFSYIVGIAGGLAAARFHDQWPSQLIMFLVGVGVSLPSFLLAPLLILVFSFELNLLPPALWDGPQYYVLPVITLGFRSSALITRLVRSSALDILQSDFVRTARAKGVTETRILSKHILKNSLIPVLGLSGSTIANALSGSFVVEVLFAIPGLGHYFIDSVIDRDYPFILALTLLYGFILSVSYLVVDLTTSCIDPRIEVT